MEVRRREYYKEYQSRDDTNKVESQIPPSFLYQ